MLNDKRVLALIPARGGSKRLPRKNIRLLKGIPLIGWTITAAKQSQYIDEIFISTDDQEILEYAKTLAVWAPELRPAELATDSATSSDVISYTLSKYGNDYDLVVLLQPTSPFRSALHIDEALELLIVNQAEMVASVTHCEHSPLWANTLPANHSLNGFIKTENLKRAQDLPNYYRLNGAIYVFDIEAFLQNGSICYGEKSFAYLMNNEHSIDIDNEYDFWLAEAILRMNNIQD
ncbi:cytidylyltransferase domain-containing protein [Shewanella litorisediminis]|uniref:Acylneuraminate cytidylyltransferase family protein n=1 Tax=Shewanella litorisediminis TaxID=1173586 RepID=A0ABX7FZZ8_9GAMM|nr:acylneuraminate cytidylyltransferase family protein [Shewanella litorisediminis]MCL2918340.1 acylneuraminate cytidylyltransferase family protein [Shewanella litorisediminis]QRH00613.1 acylneuraminate cytidylyltransferase family protein [Shewanella litorisediminis]